MVIIHKVLSAFFLLISFLSFSATAQGLNEVSWRVSSKQVTDRIFEVHFTATIQHPWHIYAQDSPEDVTMPTSIQFSSNPLVEMQDKPKEIGKLVKVKDDITGLTLKYYAGQVDFVQVVRLKGSVKTTLSGTINYMTCTDAQCLPPASRRFNVALSANYPSPE